ncbi:hypothetical protein LY56_00512 [Roseinatronobacter thiooxidans]|uniref:FlgN protein n=1 Tax=Roseinatronobacter thiooxidans TaxID=121821 RepID=A0A2W7QU33_9RHOB|nr:hypothetical protein [Roseinatronobacter thiooxidans]PZX47217.1 hypothetical protein LY56_00512 [Roseinatronobacter thiooxidans]
MTAPTTQLHALLKEEEAAVLSGKYDQLEALAQAKQRAVQALDTATLPRAMLRSLHDRLRRNAALLGAAAQGVQDAKAALAQLRAGQQTHLYHQDGTSKTMQPIANRLEHKA